MLSFKPFCCECKKCRVCEATPLVVEVATDEELVSFFYNNPLLTLILASKHQSSKFHGVVQSISLRDNTRIERAMFAYLCFVEDLKEKRSNLNWPLINQVIESTNKNIAIELGGADRALSADAIYSSSALMIAQNHIMPEVADFLCGLNSVTGSLTNKLKFLIEGRSNVIPITDKRLPAELTCLSTVNNRVYKETGIRPFYTI